MKLKNYLKIIALILGISAVLSCKKDVDPYQMAKRQLSIDYPNYNLSSVNWSTEYGYQIAKFGTPTKTTTASIMTAWYSIIGSKASREMDTENLGNAIPNDIKPYFVTTVYNDTDLWTINEIVLQNNYNENGIEQVYEMELNSKTNSNLEAELFFNAKTGILLISKKSINNDEDKDRFVVNKQLSDAVKKEYPGAEVVNAEIINNQIDVEGILSISDKEVELLFTMTYILMESKLKYKTTYGSIPTEFKSTVQTWFSTATVPTPPATTEVEISEGNLSDDNQNNYKYGVEIEYKKDEIDYKVMFYLDEDHNILKVTS